MMQHGDFREGSGFILAQRKGWRPSETCNIKGGDVSLPGEGWDDGVIALGVGRGTKSRREEFSLIGTDEQLELALLRKLKAMTSDEELMFGGDPGNLSRALSRALQRLGLESLGVTPHSARAGFATDGIVNKIPFQQLKIEGRWQSDSSLKIYIDAIMSRAISSVPSVARWRSKGEALEQTLLESIE